jgi:hypothetical protein
MATFLGVRTPIVGREGMMDQCSFRSSDEGKEHELGTFHGLGYKGNPGMLVVTGPDPKWLNGHKRWPAGQGS